MAVKNCPLCGKVFNDQNGLEAVCTTCKPEYDLEFDRVRELLYDHPEYNIVQVSELLGISVSRLKLYLREGRLIAIENHSASLLSCEDCGRPIDSGVYCAACEYKHRSGKGAGHYVGGTTSTKMHSRTDRKDR